jgi:hypothetical protein
LRCLPFFILQTVASGNFIEIFILLPLGGIVSDVIRNPVVGIFIPDDVFVITIKEGFPSREAFL